MRTLRAYAVAFVALLLLLLVGGKAYAIFLRQRDQISVTVIINVTPAPVPYHAQPRSATSGIGIVARMQLRAVGSSRNFDGPTLDLGNLVAQTNQKAVRVEAEVSPNPLGTLLYSDQNAVTLNATAGTSTAFPCVYHVTADTTRSYWQLEHGVSSDFATNFLGGDLANNTYISTATPRPTATPFAVYADDGGVWAPIGTGSYMETFCVGLTITIPVSVPQGSYSTNAVYTLYF